MLGELVLIPLGPVNLAPMVEAVPGVLGLGVPEVNGCCPVVGVLPRSAPEGLGNLDACPAVVTVAGELVLSPVEANVGALV